MLIQALHAMQYLSSPAQAGQERQAMIKQSFINAGHLDLYATKTTNPSRAVVSGGARGALAPPEFGSSVNQFPTRGGRLCPPDY